MSIGVLQIIAVAGVVLSVILLGVVFMGPDRRVERDLEGRLGSYADDTQDGGFLARIPLLNRFARSAEEAARRRGLLTAINSTLEQANLPLRPGEAVLAAVAGSVVLGIIAGAIFNNWLVGIIAGVVAILLVFYGVQQAAARERRRFEDQLPDTLNLLATSLRAGYSLLQAIEAVSREASEPSQREFSRALSDIRLGMAVPTALRGVAQRMGSIDFDWAVMAVEIQREVGGNLAEVLTSTAETLLARQRLRREVRALTAEGRMSAIVLTAVPLLLFGFLFLINPDYLDPLFDTTIGLVMLIGSGILVVIGIFWMRRIVDIEI